MKPTPVVSRWGDDVYEPYEDSFFLLDCLEKDEQFLQSLKAPVVVEIGTGTGIVSAFLPNIFPAQNYVPLATDINPIACTAALDTWNKNWSNSRLDVIRGDLLSCMRPHCVDVLIFNPPYVPSETVPKQGSAQWIDFALDGGDSGMEVTQRVLDNMGDWLSENGVAYILFCASNRPKEVCERLNAAGWVTKHIDTRRAGWEILSVYRISKK